MDGTAASPQLLVPGPGTINGLSVLELKSQLLSDPVRTLKGLPELHSRIGATVHPLKMACFADPLEPISPLWYTPLSTMRLRWSNVDRDRSSLGKRLSCGASSDCRSVESSIAC